MAEETNEFKDAMDRMNRRRDEALSRSRPDYQVFHLGSPADLASLPDQALRDVWASAGLLARANFDGSFDDLHRAAEEEMRRRGLLKGDSWVTTEREMTEELLRELAEDGIPFEQEVRCDAGVVDVLTPTTAYEFAVLLTAESLYRAAEHVAACAARLDVRAVVIAARAEGNLDEAIREVEAIGVEVVIRS